MPTLQGSERTGSQFSMFHMIHNKAQSWSSVPAVVHHKDCGAPKGLGEMDALLNVPGFREHWNSERTVLYGM